MKSREVGKGSILFFLSLRNKTKLKIFSFIQVLKPERISQIDKIEYLMKSSL